jgi:hypothetical protein
VNVKTLRGLAVTAGAAALAASAVTGCSVDFNPGTQHETKTYDIPGNFPSFGIHADSGRVELVGTDRQGIRVQEFLRWSNEKNKPRTSRTVRNGTLNLSHKCAHTVIGYSACGASYRVEVPRSTAISVHTDSGQLDISGITGKSVRLSTDSGRIDASGIRTKDLYAQSDAGQIDVDGEADTAMLRADSGSINVGTLRVRSVSAATQSGSIAMNLTSVPSKVETMADSGSVALTLPVAEQGYAMDLSSDTGGQSVDPDLRRNDSSPYVIRARTDSGSIAIEAAESAVPGRPDVPEPPRPPQPPQPPQPERP